MMADVVRLGAAPSFASNVVRRVLEFAHQLKIAAMPCPNTVREWSCTAGIVSQGVLARELQNTPATVTNVLNLDKQRSSESI